MSILHELGIRKRSNKLKEEFLYTLASSYMLCEKEISSALAPYGLSSVKMNALLVVKHIGKNKGISQVNICKKMIVSAGNMTGLINRLERQKLVERIIQSVDRRVNLIKITKKGADLLDKVWPIYKNKVDQVIPLSRAKIITTVAALSRLRERIYEIQQNL